MLPAREGPSHPRFHIGESILPRTELLLRELGLSERVRTLPHLPKYGAEFGFGDDFHTLKFGFTDGLLPGFRSSTSSVPTSTRC